MGSYLTKYNIQVFPIDVENPKIYYGKQNRTPCYSRIASNLDANIKDKDLKTLQVYLIIALPKEYPVQDATYTHKREDYKIENFKKWAEILNENLDLNIEFIEKDNEVYYKVNLTSYLHEYVTFKSPDSLTNAMLYKFLILITTLIRYSYECIVEENARSKVVHIVDNYELNKELINRSNFLYFIMYNILTNDSYHVGAGHTFGVLQPKTYYLWKYTGKSLLSKLFQLPKLASLPAINLSGNVTFLATGLLTQSRTENNLTTNPNHIYKTPLDFKPLIGKSFKEFYEYILNIKQNG